MAKRIVGVTGCRSEYDILYPVLKKMSRDSYFDVSVVVTGAHLSDRFGCTVSEIERDGLRISDRIYGLIDSDRKIGKAKSAAVIMSGLSDTLNRLEPDFVLAAGDREEAVISGVVCTYLGIPFIHLCGGDRTSPPEGDVDEPVRHAASRLASLHFTMNEEHKKRLIRSGEQPWRVYNAGDPGLDRFKEVPRMSRNDVGRYFGFSREEFAKPLVFVIQHVISGEAEEGRAQIKAVLDALLKLPVNCVINYPNSDMGSRGIIQEIEKYRHSPRVKITRNIPRNEFVNLLRVADLLAGNSSMAIIEGCYLKVPGINVGHRNKERLNGGNVVFVKPAAKEIFRVAKKILFNRGYRAKLKRCRSVYGDGHAAGKIVKALKRLKKTRRQLLAKDITF